jgi:energy-coupling factor transporter ATP-binding protein EcfA2
MIAYNSTAAGKGAAGAANGGHVIGDPCPPASLPPYRAQLAGCGEQHLVHHLVTTLGDYFPRSLLINYYVSLKTNPFVVLTGREGAGRAALAAGFAAALVGHESGQVITIGSDRWARRYSQSSYYRGIHERFGVSQYLETLHEAAAPENSGKVYLVLLKGLTADELDLYLNRLVRPDCHGERHLALPGIPAAEQPLLPPNCFITATMHVPRGAPPFELEVFQHAGQIEFGPDLRCVPTLPALPLPPVGLQRVMLRAICRDPRQARARLGAILGPARRCRLGPSAEVVRLLVEGGASIPRDVNDTVLPYVANSFDEEGRGLFDPFDAWHNARQAYDAQIVQRLLWRVNWQQRALHRRLAELLHR